MSKIENKTASIAIAGTVGVGKSTLANKLGEMLDFKVMHENVQSNPYLDKYYSNFNKWAFHLQIFFLAERFKDQKKMFSYGGGFIMDRSIYEDIEIFAKMNYEKGTMSEDDWDTYKSLFEAMVLSPYFEKPDLIIYLEGDIDHVVNRINERGRDMEVQTDVEYWRELDTRYKTWIDEINDMRVLRLNINEYDVHDDDSMTVIVEKIKKLVNA
ncbi:deoxynucleoside kinase [Mollicutes bacterium LVI A0078]|nr:deoxynucleoside kinase [Mollicutes bacterium LVI A0075]WOO91657.1 deoxynucleoside kinase [Mollicutes bacterium LVI A0078]